MSTYSLPTPKYDVNEASDSVYEPREDSFLLLDALEADLEFIKSIQPSIILEIGPGSGVIITALASFFQHRIYCIAIDINSRACLATRRTANLNSVEVDTVNGDLVECLIPRRSVDVLLFNPPYVPSNDSDERGDDLDRAWAGGSDNGRRTLDRLFPKLIDLMSDMSLGYVVVIEENRPEEVMAALSANGFRCIQVLKRKVIGEKLSVIRFSRGI